MMKNQHWIKKLFWLSLLLPGVLQAEFLDLATMPLQTSGSSDVKPNLMFVLDNSGSMGWDYAPDWSNSSSPWLFNNADYNTQYYNPEVQYSPPLNYLGASMANQTNFAAVPNEVSDLGAGKNGNTDIRSIANYYAFIPGEFCSTPSLTSCVISKEATGNYIYASNIRWCNSSTAAARRSLTGSMYCQKIRNASSTVNDGNTYTNLRRPLSTYTLTLNKTSNNATIQSIKINNIELLSSTVSVNSSYNSSQFATEVRSNMCRTSLSGNCNLSGNTVNISSNVLTIITPAGEPVNTSAPIQVTMTGGNYTAQLTTNTTTDIPGSMVYVKISSDVAYTAPGKTTKGLDRVDCASAASCTLNEEMTNYANWWAYYRTRMQSMKTAASQAFKSLDSRYRVGIVTINSPKSNYLALAPFNTSQKQSWYQKLFAVSASGGTPLRTALSSVGQHFAGKQTLGNDDPMQYACQSNFTLLTTDGYWNDSSNPTRINSSAIGDQDGSSPRPQYDSSAKSNTLADTAKYFYDTDIRDNTFSNCNGGLGSSVCGTTNDYPKQNMVTMTLGLGIDGTLVYTEDYKTRTSGDFKDISSNAKNWPDPTANEDGTRIDDLWHAAVNAGGTYYSASNPKLLRESLAKGLSEIKSIQGASAAAAASSLAPTNGDNFQYVASYQSVKWTGNLEARTVDTTSLQTSENAVWCVENVAAETCTSPATATSQNGKLYCKTTNADQTACGSAGGALGSAIGMSEPASCYVPIASSCTGKLQNQLGPNRKIYFNVNNARTPFIDDNLPAQHRDALEKGYKALSQMQGLPASDRRMTEPNKAGKLVDYLRGNKTYEDTGVNAVADNRWFRERLATLGDISQSRPAYFKASNVDYLDPGYKAYKAARKSQPSGTVYVGANDGMLHAFNADNGNELWAFIPTPVIANLANLADKEYGSNYHTNYVNGSPVVTDVCVSSCSSESAVWRTILISGLNGGGRGYFALDVTAPEDPVLLWEFYAQASGTNSTLGYTFGNPLVTKMQDGRWVVLLTSGYNNGTNARKLADGTFVSNAPTGNGGGYLYVLDANTGSMVKTISTGVGSAAEPSGLGRISAYADQMFENNTALNVYGGDLNGNIWRFNINTGAATKIATLTDGGGGVQKITTQPELGKVDNNKVVMVGTGKFLEPADLTNTPQNSAYVFKDNGQISPIGRGQLTAQVLGGDRTVTLSKDQAVNFDTGYGWVLDFPAGERVNLDPLLLNGALMMPTMVPSSQACNGAGYGWFNFFNYKKGGSMLTSGIVSERMTTPAVGFNIVYDGNGVPHVVVTGSNDPTPQQLSLDDQVFGLSATSRSTEIFKQKTNGSFGTKQSWHELIQ
ncbi:pilus assembly protein [Methylophilus sp. 5]|uniref:pilus assembly protein n=1 Tax=Methylophilus sp. 5 TaxID=1112274 RepID=UPI001E321BB1|nr:PilC/PilY family type IV pilus protein [Methylophilus sp. 5]